MKDHHHDEQFTSVFYMLITFKRLTLPLKLGELEVLSTKNIFQSI